MVLSPGRVDHPCNNTSGIPLSACIVTIMSPDGGLPGPFKCVRSRLVYLALGYGFLIVFVVMAVAFLRSRSHGPQGQVAGLICAVAAIAALVLVIRAYQSSVVRVESDGLLYKSLLKDRRFPKRDISRIDIDLRNRPPSPLRFQQPKIEMRDGSAVWLVDFSVTPAKQGSVSGDGVDQIVMVLQLSEWLRT